MDTDTSHNPSPTLVDQLGNSHHVKALIIGILEIARPLKCHEPYNNDCLVHSPRHMGLIPSCRDLIIKIVWFFHCTVKVNPIMQGPSQWRLPDPFTTIWG
ncbi:hypothetical protein WN943_025480 [Citrus x changshan-huyou]